MSLLFFMFFWLRFEVSSFRAPQEDSPSQVFICVFVLFWFVWLMVGNSNVSLSRPWKFKGRSSGRLFTLLQRTLDEPIT